MTHDEQDIDLPGQFNSIEVINAQLGTVGKTQGKESSTPDAAMLSQQIQEVVARVDRADADERRHDRKPATVAGELELSRWAQCPLKP